MNGHVPQGDSGAWRPLFAAELREFRFHPRALHLLPAAVAGIVATAWTTGVAPILLPAVMAAFAALEPQYNNMLARHPHEREALALLPVSWEAVVRAKNCAAIVLTLAVYLTMLCTFMEFSSRPVDAGILVQSAALLWSVMFPLLILGNATSVRRVRRECGLRMDDVYEALWMLVTLLVAAVPYLFLAVAAPGVLLAYGAVLCAVWLRVSIPGTARRIASSFPSQQEQHS
jgi:hypothetical protein